MRPIIKWPGGKSREIDEFERLIPQFERYIEPFFGGGALFFHLEPSRAAVNDISRALMSFYALAQRGDALFRELLEAYGGGFARLAALCGENSGELLGLYRALAAGEAVDGGVSALAARLAAGLGEDFARALLLDRAEFERQLARMAGDKLRRTAANDAKRPFSPEDLRENLVTGFMSGFYMYFRGVFNDLALGRAAAPSEQYAAANFYFVREYCYGSMFRYNAAGEFNIPYGGMSYNRKDMRAKIEAMFAPETAALLSRAELSCADFEDFLRAVRPTERDFMFLDPPYDSDFSAYEGASFTHADHERLAAALRATEARFILVIKNTDFIAGLYREGFNVLSFGNQYSYNVRSRNERAAEHLIVTNLPV